MYKTICCHYDVILPLQQLKYGRIKKKVITLCRIIMVCKFGGFN